MHDAPDRAGWRHVLEAYRTEIRLAVVVAALIVVFTVLFPDQFGTLRNAENLSRYIAVLFVVTLGQSFALLVGGFDISVAATMGLSSTVAALVMLDYGMAAGLVAGLLAAAAVGLINGVLIAVCGVSPFVATLGVMSIVTGYANVISDGRSVSGLPDSVAWIGRADWGPVPSALAIAGIAGLVSWALLNWTRTGLNLYAIGGSRAASVVAGVPVRRYELLAYTMCGLCAGLAGLMLMSRVGVGQASLGSGYELRSIATAVIGGFVIGGGAGRISGIVLGVLLLSILTTGMNIAGISEFVQQMLTGAVLVGAVLVDRFRRTRSGRRPAAGPPSVVAYDGAPAMPSPNTESQENS